MFQYAAGRALSILLDLPLLVDLNSFASYKLHKYELEKVFNLSLTAASQENLRDLIGIQSNSFIFRFLSKPPFNMFRSKHLIVEPHLYYWEEINDIAHPCYLSGYWQSQKYFDSILDVIRQDFSFRELPPKITNFDLSNISLYDSVSVHIRRGDYLAARNKSIYATCSLKYYQDAIEYVASQVNDPFFYIFSDDTYWAKQHIVPSYPHMYVDAYIGSQSFNNMILMSLCNHHIIANSTFSWWSAWLNPSPCKIVIGPSLWYHSALDSSDIMPSSWLRIEN